MCCGRTRTRRRRKVMNGIPQERKNEEGNNIDIEPSISPEIGRIRSRTKEKGVCGSKRVAMKNKRARAFGKRSSSILVRRVLPFRSGIKKRANRERKVAFSIGERRKAKASINISIG